MSDSDVTFGCAISSAENEAQACLLAESIRANGGCFSGSVVRVYCQGAGYTLSDRGRAAFERLEVQIGHFELDANLDSFPFARKVFAAAAAEDLARGHADLLVWLDPDSIVFQEPMALILGQEKTLGCRPVDHLLIGSPYDQAADAFWTRVYESCGVDEGSLFAMTTSADEIRIRPYINAGMLVVRPEAGLLSGWRDRFRQAMNTAAFEAFFAQDILYRIFLHQAILTGVILAKLRQQQIQVLPHLVNYPLHMHQRYPVERRPGRMNDLISGRYDILFHDPSWPDLIPGDEPLHGWLARQVTAYGLATGETQ